MRYHQIMREGEVIPFPTKSPAASPDAAAASAALPAEVRHGAPDNRLSFIRIANPEATPGQRTLDLVWNSTLVRLPPLVVRAIMNLKTSAEFVDTQAERDRKFKVTREGDDLRFEFGYMLDGKEKWSSHISTVPFAVFAAKAEKLLADPRQSPRHR
jgi:hypothetical protein